MKICTEKEQENCECELLGCDGCYYNKKDNNCLHCNNNKPLYCEECYQKLIGENAKLQKEVKELEISNKELDKECTRLERKEKELEDYIPKLKIKEIIENMKQDIEDEEYGDYSYLVNSSISDTEIVIEFLERLLIGGV